MQVYGKRWRNKSEALGEPGSPPEHGVPFNERNPRCLRSPPTPPSLPCGIVRSTRYSPVAWAVPFAPHSNDVGNPISLSRKRPRGEISTRCLRPVSTQPAAPPPDSTRHFEKHHANSFITCVKRRRRCDAPTRIRVGSHADVARQLAPTGVAGLTLRELAADDFASSAHRREELALGRADTVYLCHPFLVHAAQRHRGTAPCFMAQPPLMPREPISLRRADEDYSPVEQAILRTVSAPTA